MEKECPDMADLSTPLWDIGMSAIPDCETVPERGRYLWKKVLILNRDAVLF
jgi:hypothetical protein